MSTSLSLGRFMPKLSREELEMFLENASDPKCESLVAMLQDPAYRSKTLSSMAKLCGLKMSELQLIVAESLKQIAMMNMSVALPDIMEDVVTDARTTTESCPRCDGFGFIPSGENGQRDCPSCVGKGRIRRIGDRHARDLVFEAAHLKNQKGPAVAIQQNFSMGDDRMESMLKKTRQIVLDEKVITNGSNET